VNQAARRSYDQMSDPHLMGCDVICGGVLLDPTSGLLNLPVHVHDIGVVRGEHAMPICVVPPGG
jgi:hypothetical protein